MQKQSVAWTLSTSRIKVIINYVDSNFPFLFYTLCQKIDYCESKITTLLRGISQKYLVDEKNALRVTGNVKSTDGEAQIERCGKVFAYTRNNDTSNSKIELKNGA